MNNTNLNNKVDFVEAGRRELDRRAADEVVPDSGENKEDLSGPLCGRPSGGRSEGRPPVTRSGGEKYLKYTKKFYLKTLFNKTLPIYINPYEKNPKEVIDEISSQLKYLYIPPDYSSEFSVISCGKNILNIELENGIGYYLQNNNYPYIIFKLKKP